jgi:NADH-quinone oxidoreductase subunit F
LPAFLFPSILWAEQTYICLRVEYPDIVPVLENASNEARGAGYWGENFDIEIRVGAGACICGEETALFESIEGKRGFPRIKPPFPTTHGISGKPTIIPALGIAENGGCSSTTAAPIG